MNVFDYLKTQYLWAYIFAKQSSNLLATIDVKPHQFFAGQSWFNIFQGC